MIAKLRQALSGGFVRAVAMLAGGTIAGQLIMMLALPVLTRLYDPEAFGLLGVYMSAIAILIVVANMRLEIAVPLPEEEEDAASLLVLCLGASVLVAGLIGVAVLAFPAQITSWLGMESFAPYLWMLPVGVWLGGLYAVFYMWSMRTKRFGDVARTQMIRAAGGSGTQVGMGIYSAAPFGLLLGHLFYLALGSLRLARLAWRNEGELLQTVSLSRMRKNLVQQWRFPVLSVPEALLDSSTANLPVILIGIFVGPAEAGFMLLVNRVSSVPLSLLGTNISKVYLSQATEKRQAGELGAFTRKIMWTLFRIGVGPFLLLALSAPFVMPFVFGEDWARAGAMLAWVMPFMLGKFVVSPVSSILHATRRQATALAMQVFGFVLVIGGMLLNRSIFPAYSFEVFALLSLAYYCVYFAVIWHTTQNEDLV